MPERDSEEVEPLYPRLTPLRAREMGPELVGSHQRQRLMGAMIAAVDERGYGAVSVERVVALAGVSKSAFYRQFEGKEECFLETFEEIVRLGAEQIEAAAARAEDPRGRLRAAWEAFLSLAGEADAAGRLVFLASLEVGAAALAARERAAEPFRRILTESFAAEGGGASDLVIRALVGGTHEVVYRRLRDGEPERLEAEMDDLIEWGLGYCCGGGPASIGHRLLGELYPSRQPTGQKPSEELWDWAESLEGERSRRGLEQRERILRATAQEAVEGGYGRLSVGAISTRAGTSNQTFYENFAGKEEAFLAAFDTLAMRSYGVTAVAFRQEEGRLTAGAAGMGAMLGLLARDTLYSRLAFIELPSAGPAGWERAEAMLDIFIGFLEPDPPAPEVGRRPPRVVLEAIGGGVWTIVRQEINAGRGDRLPELAEELIDFALLPFEVG